jgi:hypothetical protein
MKIRVASVVLAILYTGLFAVAQETAPNTSTPSALVAASTSSPVPRLVRFASVAKDTESKPLTAITGITFLLYKDQEGGAPLWMETQNVQPDSSGRYSVQLGATKPDGLPTDVFTSGEARWLAVEISGQPEQARVLLLSVPYALKAADAETIGGLPPSAFMRANSNTSANENFSGLRSGNGDATSAASAGAPNQEGKPGPQTKTLDYVAKFTAAGGALGNSLIFDNGTDVGVATSTPAFPLDVNGTANALSYNLAGKAFAFGSYANGNAFLGFSGNSGTTGSSNTANGYNALANNSTGGANTATGYQALIGNSTGSGNVADGYDALSRNSGAYNVATGYQALLKNTGGSYNVASGNQALQYNTSGGFNTASGSSALQNNTSGGFNTASGLYALSNNTTGTYDTALGANAGPDSNSTNLTNATAIGANAVVSESNALALGGNGSNAVNVGIGTAMPSAPLHIAGPASDPPSGLQSANNGLLMGLNSTSTYKWIQSYGGPLAINPVGNNVGIGTTAPAYTLDVHGAGNFVSASGNGINATGSTGSSGSNGVAGYGGAAQSRESAAGGAGGYFIGGNAVEAGTAGYGVFGMGGTANGTEGFAADFSGNINVTGAIFAGTKDFKIDHPLDPANKYLYHASVESSEMMNIYTGNVTTDGQGDATVQLPAWFEALNIDFRYQLTAIGQFAQAIVSSEVANHQFSIKTDKPNVKISWQITGVRQDAYAKAHPLVVEQEKDARERGHYIHPELYGAPEQQSIEWARNPQMMTKIQEMKARQAAEALKKNPEPK